MKLKITREYETCMSRLRELNNAEDKCTDETAYEALKLAQKQERAALLKRMDQLTVGTRKPAKWSVA